MPSSHSLHVRMTDGRDRGLVIELDREIALEMIDCGRAVLPEVALPMAEAQIVSEKPPGGPQPVLAGPEPPAGAPPPPKTPGKGSGGRFRGAFR